MIFETIVTTQNSQGQVHIAPMGIKDKDGELIIKPFKPSATLDNLLATGVAAINFCDDVRVFAGCIIGKKDWPLVPAKSIPCFRLACALAHSEVKLIKVVDDFTRPQLFCTLVEQINHSAFKGFNRAQYSVLEAAILVSRLNMLPFNKIETELDYLRIGLEKTAGARELEAWGWLVETINNFKEKQPS